MTTRRAMDLFGEPFNTNFQQKEMRMTREFTRREHQGAAAPNESCEERNKRMGWGCSCHGMTFCPDLVCVGYEDDVPVFERRRG